MHAGVRRWLIQEDEIAVVFVGDDVLTVVIFQPFTLGILPFLAIFCYRNWPGTLRIFFRIVVPAWFGVHFFAALVAETRLLLVPQALIFIPGALFGITAAAGSEHPAS